MYAARQCISQEKSFIAAPEAGAHKDAHFGTHHARDAWELFHTRGFDLNLFSSAIKLNTQYMHSIWFNLRVQRPVTLDDVIEKLAANPYVAVIGPPESSESRLTLVQAFNTTGDVLAIIFGQQLILAARFDDAVDRLLPHG